MSGKVVQTVLGIGHQILTRLDNSEDQMRRMTVAVTTDEEGTDDFLIEFTIEEDEELFLMAESSSFSSSSSSTKNSSSPQSLQSTEECEIESDDHISPTDAVTSDDDPLDLTLTSHSGRKRPWEVTAFLNNLDPPASKFFSHQFLPKIPTIDSTVPRKKQALLNSNNVPTNHDNGSTLTISRVLTQQPPPAPPPPPLNDGPSKTQLEKKNKPVVVHDNTTSSIFNSSPPWVRNQCTCGKFVSGQKSKMGTTYEKCRLCSKMTTPSPPPPIYTTSSHQTPSSTAVHALTSKPLVEVQKNDPQVNQGHSFLWTVPTNFPPIDKWGMSDSSRDVGGGETTPKELALSSAGHNLSLTLASSGASFLRDTIKNTCQGPLLSSSQNVVKNGFQTKKTADEDSVNKKISTVHHYYDPKMSPTSISWPPPSFSPGGQARAVGGFNFDHFLDSNFHYDHHEAGIMSGHEVSSSLLTVQNATNGQLAHLCRHCYKIFFDYQVALIHLNNLHRF